MKNNGEGKRSVYERMQEEEKGFNSIRGGEGFVIEHV
jgi:hypothetical protein